MRRRRMVLSLPPKPDCVNLIRLYDADKGAYSIDGQWYDGTSSLTIKPVLIKDGETKIAVSLEKITYGSSSRINFWESDGRHLVGQNFSGDGTSRQVIAIPESAHSFTISLNLSSGGVSHKNTEPIYIHPQAEWGETFTEFTPHPEDVKRGVYYGY